MACCAGSEFNDQRHQQTLALDPLCGTLPQNALEKHALVRHMLIDDPESVFVDGKNKRVSNLAQRTQCSQRFESWSGLRLLRDRRRATVVGNRLRIGGCFRRSRQRDRRIRLDRNPSFKFKPRRYRRNARRLQRKTARRPLSVKSRHGARCAPSLAPAPSANGRLPNPGLLSPGVAEGCAAISVKNWGTGRAFINAARTDSRTKS